MRNPGSGARGVPVEAVRRHAAVLVGGALGAGTRWWVAAHLGLGGHFPFAVLAINVTGSFALGCAHPLLLGTRVRPEVRLAATTGFLGGYTTFSTWMAGSWALWAGGSPLPAVVYVATTLVLGLAAGAAGLGLARGAGRRGRRKVAE